MHTFRFALSSLLTVVAILLGSLHGDAAEVVIGHPLGGSQTFGASAGDGFADLLVIHPNSPVVLTQDIAVNPRLTAFTLANDSDTATDTLDILLLRSNGASTYEVISQALGFVDDTPSATTGDTTYTLATPLEVQAGDIFAHFHDLAPGSVPYQSTVNASFPLSYYNTGLSSRPLIGDTVSATGGPRNYGINFTITGEVALTPEPSSLILAAVLVPCMAGFFWFRRRENT